MAKSTWYILNGRLYCPDCAPDAARQAGVDLIKTAPAGSGQKGAVVVTAAERRAVALSPEKRVRTHLVLVGLETLKAGFGWSDEEMDENFCFDLQVRYALGYRQLGEGHFELRTMYNFRHRLSEHMQTTGEDLLVQAFAQVTDEQVVAFSLKTTKLGMDSTQLPATFGTTAGCSC